jgi:hypothetical protein
MSEPTGFPRDLCSVRPDQAGSLEPETAIDRYARERENFVLVSGLTPLTPALSPRARKGSETFG